MPALRRWTILAAVPLSLALGGGGILYHSSGSESAAAAPKGKTLTEAMNERRGTAAGDPLHDRRHQEHKRQDPNAAGVDKGSKKQAADVKMDTKKPVTGDDLYTDGDFSGGCTVGYGLKALPGKGRACLPITPPSAGAMGMSVQEMPWTCREVRALLPEGITVDVIGIDPAHLDRNGDGMACGPSDA